MSINSEPNLNELDLQEAFDRNDFQLSALDKFDDCLKMYTYIKNSF